MERQSVIMRANRSSSKDVLEKKHAFEAAVSWFNEAVGDDVVSAVKRYNQALCELECAIEESKKG